MCAEATCAAAASCVGAPGGLRQATRSGWSEERDSRRSAARKGTELRSWRGLDRLAPRPASLRHTWLDRWQERRHTEGLGAPGGQGGGNFSGQTHTISFQSSNYRLTVKEVPFSIFNSHVHTHRHAQTQSPDTLAPEATSLTHRRARGAAQDDGDISHAREPAQEATTRIRRNMQPPTAIGSRLFVLRGTDHPHRVLGRPLSF